MKEKILLLSWQDYFVRLQSLEESDVCFSTCVLLKFNLLGYIYEYAPWIKKIWELFDKFSIWLFSLMIRKKVFWDPKYFNGGKINYVYLFWIMIFCAKNCLKLLWKFRSVLIDSTSRNI